MFCYRHFSGFFRFVLRLGRTERSNVSRSGLFAILCLLLNHEIFKVQSSDVLVEGNGGKGDKIFAIPIFQGNFSDSLVIEKAANEARRQSLSLADLTICSLHKSQKSHQTILWYPGNQESIVRGKKFKCPTKRMRTLDFPDGQCWVQYKTNGIVDLLVQLMHKENIYLIESDQLFFRDVGVIKYVCEDCDIGFTFTEQKKAKFPCLNFGFVYIRKVNEKIITFFQKLAHSVEREISFRGCSGGVDQYALCRMLKGYLPPNRKRTLEGDLKIASLNRKKFNPSKKQRGGISCSGANGVYLSHFIGARKTRMLSRACLKQYNQFTRKLNN